ncbi:HAD-IIIC family phosphatase [Mucilaginibacter glaciei]|uniref:HAD family hydrolase n=1 Tax=Mucilaginibacter glaciei TaxID=2772109 RepID=A0A926S7H7_9SPHI|nr:HAD-IIIC family phosphatase [Mucilaginibacter glaciei]MBD1394706.1 HAD family hydrolase [Mucilaginibacter glaciei]
MLSFSDLKKNIKNNPTGLTPVKVALLADSASQFINTAIRGYGAELGLNLELYEADYNQIEQQVYGPTSELYAFAPVYIVIIQSTEHLLHSFYKQDDRTGFTDQVIAKTIDLYNILSQRLKTQIIINTYIEINDQVFGSYAAKTQSSFLYQLRKINLGLMDLASENTGLYITDLASLSAVKGYENTFDTKMYIYADMAFGIDFLPAIGQSICQIIASTLGKSKKCIVLDLDNTLWGGVIGDDGIENIMIGSLGMGKAFTQLQLWCRELKNRGIILAVCSKNTLEIAQEPFISHPDMVLKLDDISLFVANWENKVDNIRYIQQVLNIGMDSMVFLDDNPFEREMVKSAIPQLTIPSLPDDPADYMLFLRELNLFDTASFTEDDKDRTEQYRQQAQRTSLQNSFVNEADYLASLDMQSRVNAVDKFTLPRVAQLTLRSNQFNLRNMRYNEADIADISSSENYFTLTFTLEDKFGDNGLIAVIILKTIGEDTLFIDTWIMSCRVLKRGMENFTLNNIVQAARDHGFSKIMGECLPTKKNGIVKDHYQNLGFTLNGDAWELNTYSYINKQTFITGKQ